MSGSQKRYWFRQLDWNDTGKSFPMVRHHFWWLLHNCVAHPLLGIWVSKHTVWFHDWTSKHLNVRREIFQSPMPEIPDRWSWIYHNVVGHILIGLFPIENVFLYHDLTADDMGVEDWL